MLFHQGVPLFPVGSIWRYVLALLLTAPLAVAGALFNLPPLLAGWWAGRTFSDGPNVVSLWRILVGAPASVLWLAIGTAAAIALGKPLWLAFYLLVSVMGLKLYYHVKKLAVAVHNGICHPELRARVVAFRETVLREIPDEK